MSIVKMKRLRLIGMQAERGALLKLLQHMGCVEIDEPTEFRDDPVWDSLTRPDTQALGRAREQRSELEGALKTLKKYGPRQKGGLLKARPVITEGELFDDRAYEAALADAGVQESSTTYCSAWLDYDDGRAIYDVEFRKGWTEYSFEIDAVSGTVLERDVDWD